ncbi:MAG: ATP-dependent protease ATPase subunit HslU, partial [Planctomycetota bacterium]|nr:ATP-dependent protease ATPase subunit HslU [Planctomycetota bacterium]
LDPEVRKDVTPKNILMIGPTGVGKTEITRRLAGIVRAPFVKIEATKYTEVGYYGRDVESMIRDLVEASITLVTRAKRIDVEEKAKQRTEERLLDLLLPGVGGEEGETGDRESGGQEIDGAISDGGGTPKSKTRDKFREMLRGGKLEERKVELTVEQKHGPVQVLSNVGMEQMDVDFQSMFEKIIPKQHRRRSVTVREAREILVEQEIEALMDKDAIHEEAVHKAESSGMVFIDEIDKVCGPDGGKGPDVSRQGVQRDLLPIVEGTTVQTRYGQVRTDHILFIAAGAFHKSKPSDLMPELQGRFPIRVELTDLTRDDFLRILTEPKAALTKQYRDLLAEDGVELSFTNDGLAELADIAHRVNQSTQNIGARRLYTILEKLLEEISFQAPDTAGKVTIDSKFVRGRLADIAKDEDLSQFIL